MELKTWLQIVQTGVFTIIGAFLSVMLARIFIQNGKKIEENGKMIEETERMIEQNGKKVDMIAQMLSNQTKILERIVTQAS